MENNDIKFLVFKYSDGITITIQWDKMKDGPWEYGDSKEKIFHKDFDWVCKNINHIDSN